MEHLLGLLRVHIHRGINLVVRDANSSDPYVVIRMGQQKLKTRVVKNDINPMWDEDLTLSIAEPLPVELEVHDSDTFTTDDKMGNAVFDTIITTVKPTRTNCLAEESHITWINEKVVQNMVLRLQNVACGEVELRLSWIDIPGCRGL